IRYYTVQHRSNLSCSSPMSANATPLLPTMGISPPTQASQYIERSPWGYNHLARLVTHETDTCLDGANWAQHYMGHVLRKDPSLSAAETQRTNAICAGLDA